MFRRADLIFDGWRWFEVALFWIAVALAIGALLWIGYPSDPKPPPYISTTGGP